jgi:imidazolonepropionase-like amidohydrolase
LTPHEGIIAATTGSARALGLHDVGTIEPGMDADLIVLNGDPLADVARLTRAEEFWMVVRDGRVVVPANA